MPNAATPTIPDDAVGTMRSYRSNGVKDCCSTFYEAEHDKAILIGNHLSVSRNARPIGAGVVVVVEDEDLLILIEGIILCSNVHTNLNLITR